MDSAGLKPVQSTETAGSCSCLFLLAAGPESSTGQQSYGDDGEEVNMEGLEARKASSGLASPMDLDRSEEHGTRMRSGRGGRGR